MAQQSGDAATGGGDGAVCLSEQEMRRRRGESTLMYSSRGCLIERVPDDDGARNHGRLLVSRDAISEPRPAHAAPNRTRRIG